MKMMTFVDLHVHNKLDATFRSQLLPIQKSISKKAESSDILSLVFFTFTYFTQVNRINIINAPSKESVLSEIST